MAVTGSYLQMVETIKTSFLIDNTLCFQQLVLAMFSYDLMNFDLFRFVLFKIIHALQVTVWIWWFNAWMNAFIYGRKSKDFNKAFRLILGLKPKD